MVEKESSKKENDNTGWIKNILNNKTLLKWVKKFSADNLMPDSEFANKFNIKTNEESLSVGDSGMTKLLITQARFGGKEYVRYNVKQIKETLDLIGDKGELIISEDNNRELFIQIDDTVVVVSPLPTTDKSE